MNIAVIPGIFFPKPGGVQVQVHNIYNNLAKNKCNVDLYLFEKTDITNNYYNLKIFNRLFTSLIFILHYYLNINLFFFLRSYLKKIIKKNNYSIWHFHFINYKSLIFINCLKSLNQKIVVTFHGIDIQIDKEIGYGYRLNKKFEKYLLNSLKNIDHFTFISQTIKDDLLKLGIEEKKMTEVPNTIDLSRFKNDKKELVENKIIKLLTVARYDEKKKGYDMLPLLSKKLIEKKINFRWSIIGKKTFLLKDKKIIKDNSKNFEIIDDMYDKNENYFPNKELIKKYIDSDLYVNLSRVESFGITFLESIAAETPVITFNKKGANELIQDNINGFVVQDQDLDIMANKINDIWNNFSLIESLKPNLHETIKKFDLNLVTKKLLNVYNLISKQENIN